MVIGAVSVFPAVYIPYLNTDVFKHTGITWEWGLSCGFVVVFVLGMEAWKFVKRSTGWFAEPGEDDDKKETSRGAKGTGLNRQGFFSFARTFSREKTLPKTRSDSGISTAVVGQRPQTAQEVV